MVWIQHKCRWFTPGKYLHLMKKICNLLCIKLFSVCISVCSDGQAAICTSTQCGFSDTWPSSLVTVSEKNMKHPDTWAEDVFAGWARGENWVQLYILLIIHDLGLKWMCIRFSLIHFIKFKTKPRSSFIPGSVTSFLSLTNQSKELFLGEFAILAYPRELGGELAFITPPSHVSVCIPSLFLSPSLTVTTNPSQRTVFMSSMWFHLCGCLQFISLESTAQSW